MTAAITPHWILETEARALLTRLARVRPFALHDPMVPAAAISPAALTAIERSVAEARRDARRQILNYLRWLAGPAGRQALPRDAQRRYVILRLRFNAVLSRFHIFADALTQRSETQTGTWLSGLDVLAADALALPGYYASPPVICYLDRGAGAAIRRARSRLPGGGENPVAIIRVPRERMVGQGIASSLVHEVGHQAAALLDLVNSLRRDLQREAGVIWRYWERWISEIVSDFWSVARIGAGSTLGLIGVVSLPRAFMFRVSLDDPHPFPWIRVKLSCAIGNTLYPHPQWENLTRVWDQFYPLDDLDAAHLSLVRQLEAHMPEFVAVLINHRPRALRGRSLMEVMNIHERQPALLASHWRSWSKDRQKMLTAPPSLVFAVLAQARLMGALNPEAESDLVDKLLTHWALRSTLDTTALCAAASENRVSAPAI